MRLLLDTHILLGWVLDDTRPSAPARAAIRSHEQYDLRQRATAWEVGIKAAKSKLRLPQGGEVEPDRGVDDCYE